MMSRVATLLLFITSLAPGAIAFAMPHGLPARLPVLSGIRQPAVIACTSDYIPSDLRGDDDERSVESGNWRPEVWEGKFPLAAALDFVADKVPGLLLTALVGGTALKIAPSTPGISPLLWALTFGCLCGTALRAADKESQTMKRANAGIDFAGRRLLRAGIILYGAKLTIGKILGIGPAGLLLDAYAVVSTLWLGHALGGALGLSRSLSTLISTGSAICGCSAVAATQPIIDADAHEVAAAVGTVVYFGGMTMCLYPHLYRVVPALAADPRLMGLYTGATMHELSGVLVAGSAMGNSVVSVAFVTKLMRVCLLEPWLFLVYGLGIGAPAKGGGNGKTGATARGLRQFPWFALGFVSVAAANSVVGFSPSVTGLCATLSSVFLAWALAGLGLKTDLVKVRQLGLRPLVLAAALWAHLVVVGFFLARLLVCVGF
jgi:uncharacterized integral membrane protein (TIGR00698 family)